MMRFLALVMFNVMSGASLALAATAAPQPLPVAAFARWPGLSLPALSPDGRHVAGLIDEGKGKPRAIAVWNTARLDAPPTIIRTKSLRFRDVEFLKDDRLLVTTYAPFTQGPIRTYITKTFLTDLAGARFEEVFRRGGASRSDLEDFEEISSATAVASRLPLNRDEVLLQRTSASNGFAELVRLDVRTGRTQRVARASSEESFDLFDPRSGEPLVKTRFESRGGVYAVRTYVRQGSEWREHPKLSYTLKDRLTINIVGFDQSGKLIVVTDRDRDTAVVQAYDVNTSEFDPKPLLESDRGGLFAVLLSRSPSDYGRLLGAHVHAEAIEQVWTDPGLGEVARTLSDALPGRVIRILDTTPDRSRVLLSASASHAPAIYYLLTDQKVLTKLGEQRPDIDPATLSPARFVTYTARDGLEIPAYVYVPKGWTRASGPLPTIVLPHGGPWSRDYLDWDDTGWPQFLASRGYAVLLPQFRGSRGWGQKLWKAGDREWGRKMQDDKDDGAAWLVSQGVADPKRIAMFGYSYGGYAAAAAAVRSGGQYQCVIAGAGVTDLSRLNLSVFGSDRIARQVQGVTIAGLDPLSQADKASIPVLMFHGDRDQRVPIFHSRDYYARARSAGKTVKIVEIPDMEHSSFEPEHVETMLPLIENFLKSDCGDGGL